MKELCIRANEAGQRLDKFLGKYMDQAPKGFLYKMLRSLVRPCTATAAAPDS